MKHSLVIYILAMLEYITSLILEKASELVTMLTQKNAAAAAAKPVITSKHITIARNYHQVGRVLVFRVLTNQNVL